MKTRVLTVILWAIAASMNAPAFAQESASGTLHTIIGKAVFEKRSTVVPMAVCETEPCPRPRPYWSMVIETETARYEVNHVFDLGNPRAPTGIELAGVLVRHGAQVEVEGIVQRITPDYGIVSLVTRAQVIHDVETPAPAHYGWQCAQAEQGLPRHYVDVFFAGQAADSRDQYYLRVFKVNSDDLSSFYPVAVIEDAEAEEDGSRILYKGSEGPLTVELEIDRVDQNAGEKTPAVLRIQDSSIMNLPIQCTVSRG